MQTTEKITLDLYAKNVVSVSAKQFDTETRYIEVTCVDKGIIFNVDKTKMSAFIRYKKPDDNGVFNNCEITDNNTINFELTQQMLVVPGRAIADIMLVEKVYTNGNKPVSDSDINAPIISIMSFYVNIAPTALDHSNIESSYEFNALTKALSELDRQDKIVDDLNKTLTENENVRQINEQNRISTESKRVTSEKERQSNEAIRQSNENTRISNENIRKDQENKRQTDTATAITNANNAAKNANDKATDLQNKLDSHHFVLTEDKDVANGVPSLDTKSKVPLKELYDATTSSKGITQLTDSVSSTSISTAATPNSVKTTYDRLLAEENRATKSESDLQTALSSEISRAKNAESAIQITIDSNKNNWNDKYTKNEIDNKFSTLESNIDWKESVNTFADIAKTYPNPEDGWTVNVKDTDYTYRYSGSQWVAISANAIPNATQSVNGLLTATDKTAYDDANSKKHTHSNKSVLDGITSALITAWNKVTDKLDKTGDASNVTNTITTASARTNLTTGEKLSISLGKIAKWFSDLKNVAFSGSYNDLSDKPTIGNGTITIKQAGSSKGMFTMNQTGDTTIELTDNNTWRPVETSLDNQDLNNIKTAGFYNAGGGNTCSNRPDGITAFGLVVIHNAFGEYYTQFCFENEGNNRIYKRDCMLGVWADWIEVRINDADTVDGFHASQNPFSKNTCVVTDKNGYVALGYISSCTNRNENPAISQIIVTNDSDNYYRKASLEHFKTALGSMPPIDHNHVFLSLYSADSRLKSCNLATSTNGLGSMFHLVATSTMTQGKPPTDCNIIQMNWDNNGGFDTQFAVANTGVDAYIRGQTKGVWGEWKTLLHSANYQDYCTPANIGAAPSVHTHDRITNCGNHTEAASGTTGSYPNEGMLYNHAMYMTQTYMDSNTPAYYGNIINLAGNGTGQLLCSWAGADNTAGHLYYRSHRDTNTGGWSPWSVILDSTNYSNYAVPVSGGTMTGSLVSTNGNLGSSDYSWKNGYITNIKTNKIYPPDGKKKISMYGDVDVFENGTTENPRLKIRKDRVDILKTDGSNGANASSIAYFTNDAIEFKTSDLIIKDHINTENDESFLLLHLSQDYSELKSKYIVLNSTDDRPIQIYNTHAICSYGTNAIYIYADTGIKKNVNNQEVTLMSFTGATSTHAYLGIIEENSSLKGETFHSDWLTEDEFKYGFYAKYDGETRIRTTHFKISNSDSDTNALEIYNEDNDKHSFKFRTGTGSNFNMENDEYTSYLNEFLLYSIRDNKLMFSVNNSYIHAYKPLIAHDNITVHGDIITPNNADYAEAFDYTGDIPRVGTIVELCGDKKVRTATKDSNKVVGVVSDSYWVLAGSSKEDIESKSKVAVGLTGQIKVLVKGTVEYGDFIVSAVNGIGKVNNEAPRGSIIGRAMESNNEEGEKLITCIIQPM